MAYPQASQITLTPRQQLILEQIVRRPTSCQGLVKRVRLTSRTEADFTAHINQTVDTDPEAGWIFIVDQLNIHKSESLVHMVAQRCKVAIDLGVKGHSGILESMTTRAAFLADPTHRIRFVYIPKHTSWLNQIECWFSILVRRLLKRASFTSVEDLRDRILAFIDYFNCTMAKPFQWKFKGYPVAD